MLRLWARCRQVAVTVVTKRGRSFRGISEGGIQAWGSIIGRAQLGTLAAARLTHLKDFHPRGAPLTVPILAGRNPHFRARFQGPGRNLLPLTLGNAAGVEHPGMGNFGPAQVAVAALHVNPAVAGFALGSMHD